MASYLTGTAVPSVVATEINARGKASPAGKWKVSKKPWMSLTSFSSKPMPISGYEKRSQSDFYDKASSGRLVATPVLNSIDQNTTGTNGSMKKATVKFTLYSLEQLKKAQRAYFIPGITAFAQWGWNMDSAGGAVTKLSATGFKSWNAGQKDIQTKVEKEKGCIDAMLGVISDFNWSFDPATKSYSCDITIDSPGKAYISGPVDVSNKGAAGCAGKEDDDKGDGNGNWMKVALKDIAERNIEENKAWSPNGYCGGSVNLDEDAKEDTPWWQQVTGFFGSPTMNYYVTWAWFESTIVSGMSPISKGHAVNKTLTSIGKSPQKTWNKGHVWRLDSSDSRMKCPSGTPYASADPWVCLIPGRFHWLRGNATGGDNGSSFGIKKAAGVGGAPPAVNSAGYLELGKILLNTYFLWTVFQDSKTIDEYVLKVAKKVNDVCGGFWNIELVDDPMDPSTMRIIDKNYVPPTPGPKLNIYGNTSCRSWGMSTEIPQALRHSIMMGTQRKTKKGSKNTDEPQGAYFDYAEGIKDTMMGNQQLDTKLNPGEKCTGAGGSAKKANGGEATDPKLALEDALATLADNRDDEAVDEVKGATKAYWNKKDPPTDKGGTVVPIGFDGTFDGIGGLHWGQLFTTDQTSNVLSVAHQFQVTNIKHSVTQDDWTTSIETALRIG
jgi:hypothetical protein